MTATPYFRVSSDYFKVVGFLVTKALQDKVQKMIEKLSSLKDKLRRGEQSDFKKKERASQKRKEERGKRVKSGRKLFRLKNN